VAYKRYLNQMVQIADAKRRRCKHEHFYEVVYFRRCSGCGSYIPFRNPEDTLKRGEIGQLDDYYDNVTKYHDHDI